MTWIKKHPTIFRSIEESLNSYVSERNKELCLGYIQQSNGENSGIPMKNQFDISLFTKTIPSLCLYAVSSPDLCIFRILGEDAKRRLGFNATGRNYYDFVPEERRPSAIRAMNMVVAIPCAMRLDAEQVFSNGYRREIEVTAFPLESEENGVDGFIVCSAEQTSEASARDDEELNLVEISTLKRDIIDLGYGIDKTFFDLVRS